MTAFRSGGADSWPTVIALLWEQTVGTPAAEPRQELGLGRWLVDDGTPEELLDKN